MKPVNLIHLHNLARWITGCINIYLRGLFTLKILWAFKEGTLQANLTSDNHIWMFNLSAEENWASEKATHMYLIKGSHWLMWVLNNNVDLEKKVILWCSCLPKYMKNHATELAVHQYISDLIYEILYLNKKTILNLKYF